ncbi:Aste57867_8615 [Aphanomyces stellatus]|uniref:Aste57867_8615 protein n=1 Tax=Aphanomyces stellatus TaxID=120398 RepID=A0A485KKV2_9STRA|nr:hypothetical protein As57867_008581 [Aphanomyces stellatus]VFT85501.1 Aste57867_8615 [Aphanomyces stellatus]
MWHWLVCHTEPLSRQFAVYSRYLQPPCPCQKAPMLAPLVHLLLVLGGITLVLLTHDYILRAVSLDYLLLALACLASVVLLVFVYSVVVDRLWPVYKLMKMYDSIQPRAPSPESTTSDPSPCVLFRHLPFLAPHVAWTPLGVFPTPIHLATVPDVQGPGTDTCFYLKREDLSSPYYGGNKVRTLEHQLAACALHQAEHPDAVVYSTGMAGSNQNVAAVVHGRERLGLRVEPCLVEPELPDLDNTLNLLSLLSFKCAVHLWPNGDAMDKRLTQAMVGKTNDQVMAFGGNNLLGVLGQMGGLLELAEQIQRRDVPDVDVLYVAVGSSCTLTGHVLGVCLARHLGLQAFKSPSFRIVAVPILPHLAEEHKTSGFYTSFWSQYHPFYPRFGFCKVASFLQSRGLDVDLEPLATVFLKTYVEFVTDDAMVGPCGTHSAASLAAAGFDGTMKIDGSLPTWMPTRSPDETRNVDALKPWLCGHFTAKVLAKLLDDVRREDGKSTKVVRLLWQTKSWIQPRGPEDEWAKLQHVTDKHSDVANWVNQGLAHSKLRPAYVHVPDGKPEWYRSVMTRIDPIVKSK